jgi:GNAT superfamily N-acetyltransferase
VADGSPAHPIWRERVVGPDGALVQVRLVQSDARPDASVIEVGPGAPMPDGVVAVATLQDGTVTRLEATADAAPKAPPLWFVEAPEPSPTSGPPATTIVAFTGGRVDPGTLLSVEQAQLRGVDSDGQLGAFRWIPHSGFGDQIYVTPAWRRRTIGTALLAAAAALSLARGWPRPWGDGQRTAQGDRMWQTARWKHLATHLTHLMPPMTPVEDRADDPSHRDVDG